MKELVKYISESILDDEDILMNDLDKSAQYYKLLSGLSNKETYDKTRSDLWHDINKIAKEVKVSKIDTSKYYIVFQLEFSDDYKFLDTKLLIPKDHGRYMVYNLSGTKDINGRVFSILCGESVMLRDVKDALPRKSIINNIVGRQIYELPQQYMFLVNLFKDLHEKLN